MNKSSRVKSKAAARIKPNATRKSIQKRPVKTTIQSKEAYELTMKTIDEMMQKGEQNLTAKELKTLGILAAAAEAYEDIFTPLPSPASLPDMIRMKLYQLRINQQLAAQLLGVSNAKFSLIMNGKQKPDIHFLKAAHEKLKLDANLLLQAL
jgi:HTH-type transcriptional regulator/antitoxin HigA